VHEICYNTALQQYPSHLRHVATLPWEIKKSTFLQMRNLFEARCSITMLKFVTHLTTIRHYEVGERTADRIFNPVAVVSPPVPSRPVSYMTNVRVDVIRPQLFRAHSARRPTAADIRRSPVSHVSLCSYRRPRRRHIRAYVLHADSRPVTDM